MPLCQWLVILMSTVENLQQAFGHIAPSSQPLPEVYTQEPEQEGERRFVLRQSAPGQTGAVCICWRMCWIG